MKIFLLLLITILSACSENKNHDQVTPGIFNYPQDYEKSCQKNIQGSAGFSDDETSTDSILYSVRTPANYQSDYQHPLIIVYSPAGKNRFSTERFVDLTDEATTAGFIIAYVDSKRMSMNAITQLSRIPEQITEKWCIHPSRVYLTGHSDGGTISMAVAFMPDTRNIPDAILPSAMGIRKEDLEQHKCPKPIPIMLMHNKDDRHFPDYGESAIDWWAKCNHCDLEKTITLDNACIKYQGCDDNGTTWYCSDGGSHSRWPDHNDRLLAFLKMIE
jgi:polyhydroxybutyrate depolymerase